jgi:hypothetical protein
MNQKQAKRIRREVYGDMALRGGQTRINDKGVLVAPELRRKYQQAKKTYNMERRA